MKNSVLKGASYVLVHAPEMVLYNGTTQTTEMIVNPESEYLKKLPEHLRSYEDAVAYPPNQTYIGNLSIEALGEVPEPWFDKKVDDPQRFGKFGEIMPEDEFMIMIQICDSFDLVKLEKTFLDDVKPRFEANPAITDYMKSLVKEGVEDSEVQRFVNDEHAEALRCDGKIVGYVKRAHDVDVNLTAHVIFENLVNKASAVLALAHLIKDGGVDPNEVDYVIECGEEACGDMNQRGGGNFAKAIAEMCGLNNATGSDTRSFCAGPSHAMVEAAALVKAGAYKNVVVVAGGCTAKMGMNGKDHVKKEMPIVEDVLAGFAILVSENDGVSPEFNLDMIGRHTVGTGSAPQNVIASLVTEPLDRAGLKITDIDKYSPEMQNPDVTKPAGAGNVPEANFKMIAALGAKRGDIEKKDIMNFVKEHGLTGFAPTQGHIPSGVPYLGYAREDIMSGKTKNAMIIGKGSLFLGRMTNLFDGVSFVIQANTGADAAGSGVSEAEVKNLIGEAMRDFAAALLKED